MKKNSAVASGASVNTKLILTEGILRDQIRSRWVYAGSRQFSLETRRCSAGQRAVFVGLINDIFIRIDGGDQFRRILGRFGRGRARGGVSGTARFLIVKLVLDWAIVIGMKKSSPTATPSSVFLLKLFRRSQLFQWVIISASSYVLLIFSVVIKKTVTKSYYRSFNHIVESMMMRAKGRNVRE